MKGRYTVREDGLIIAEADNLLTNNARVAILNHLAGTMGDWASVIAVGALETLPLSTDTTLAFEIGRGPVTVRAADIANNAVLVKATIPKNVEGEIYELGIFSSVNMTGKETTQLLLTDFDMEAFDDSSVNSSPMRIGRAGSEITVAANDSLTVTYPGLSLDIGAMTAADDMLLACFADGITEVEFRMVNSEGNYIYYTFTPPEEYGAVRWSIADFVSVGAGTFMNPFTEVEVVATAGAGGGVLSLDGLRIDEINSFAEQMLVSRALLTQPIRKSTSSEMEIEYSIRMGF